MILAASGAIITVVASLITVGDARATVSGGNGKIAFVGDTAIETMNADGTGRRRLTNNSGHAFPRWSPDGQTIAYVDGSIVTMSSSGQQVKRITNVSGGSPSWSPDGEKIAFAGAASVYVVESDGSADAVLIAAGTNPAWSPDGTKIAFVRFDVPTGHRQIWVMNPNGTGQVPITDDDAATESFLDWSPDGAKIVFQRGEPDSGAQIFVIDSDGSDEVQLTTTAQANFHPVWTPDGKKIAFARNQATGLWTMNPDGTNQIRVTTTQPFGMPSWQPVHVTVRTSAKQVAYQGTVKITAHLVSHATSSNKTVSIYKLPHGGTTKLVGSGHVNASGDFSIKTRLTKNTAVFASWSGDGVHPAGGSSSSLPVKVFANVTGRFLGSFGASGQFHLYRFTSACTDHHTHCPTYVVNPGANHAGKRLYFRMQVFASGGWRTALHFSVRIPPSGATAAIFIYRDSRARGLPCRVRAEFQGDPDNIKTIGKWGYFKAT